MTSTLIASRRYAARAWSHSPWTISLIGAFWVLAAASGSVVSSSGPGAGGRWSGWVAVSWPALAHGKVWTVLTSGLFAPNLVHLIVATLALLVVGPIGERLLGGARMLGAALVSQTLGVLAGVGYGALMHQIVSGSPWIDTIHARPWVDPLPWICGVLLAASARMSTLWRRRVRVVTFALLITMMLFAGHPQDMVRLCAALVGLVVGMAVTRDRSHTRPLGGTVRETRALIAMILAATVLGPVLVSLTNGAVGPLAPMSQLLQQVPWTAAQTTQICAEEPGGQECWNATQYLRLTGIGPLVMSLMPLVLVLVLAGGLMRGRRAALVWAVAVYSAQLMAATVLFVVGPVETEKGRRQLIFGAVPHLHTLWVVAPLVVVIATLVVLVSTARFFQVRASRHAARTAALAITGLILGGLVAFVALGSLLTDGVAATGHSSITVLDLVRDYPVRLLPPVYLGLGEPALLPVSDIATVLFEWIGVVVWGGVALVIWRFLRARRSDENPAAQERLNALLHAPGGSSLAWMTTWPGHEYWFGGHGVTGADGTDRADSADGAHSADGSQSAVAFRVIGKIALTTGGPVGPADQVGPAALEFAEHCALQGLSPCFYSVDSTVEEALRAAGWSSLQVAEETVIELSGLEFVGKKFQDIRTALNRARKEEIEAVWTTYDTASLSLVEQIVAISEEWVADKGLPEMGFTLGGLDELCDPEVRILLAVDATGVVHGVTSWLPVYRDGRLVGLTLDFMRRRTGGFRPTTEFLIASAALHARDEGLEFLSLSGAPLAHSAAEERGGAGGADKELAVGAARKSDDDGDIVTLEAALDRVGAALEPVYGFRSLLAFKAKFNPDYRPLYLVYADAAALPAIGVAVGRAYLPGVGLAESARLLGTLSRARKHRDG